MRPFAFPKVRRLLKHAEFENIYHSGRRHFSKNITVFYFARAASQGLPRVGFTVARGLGGAVERNRMKRRLRAAVREHLGSLLAPVDVVINPKKTALTVDFALLSSEVQQAFQVINAART